MKRFVRLAAALVLAGTGSLLFSQVPTFPVTVTPSLVSIQLGQPLYCAIKPYQTNQIQLYCFTTVTNTWDHLVWNQIIDPNATVGMPAIIICPIGTSTVCSPTAASSSVMWQFNADAQKLVHWAVAANGGNLKTGTFAGGAFQ